jgi:vitamin B12 transporter
MIRAYRNQSYFCFSQWSRNKFAILKSLSRVIKIGVICATYSLVNRIPLLTAQSDTVSGKLKMLELEAVQVTGRRSQAVFSDIARVVTVIKHEDFDGAGVQSIQDLLEFVSGADVRQRGAFGIQADISLRGGSFDHVMVLVNGINYSDPQTGHLSLDLPIDPETVERIEVLEGSAARVLGPGAFMGAINIITRSKSTHYISASQTFGQYRFIRTQIHAGFSTGNLSNLFSMSKSTSDGYVKHSDFNLLNFYYHGHLKLNQTLVEAQAGHQSKQFGAGGFYSPRFPNQYEEAGLWMASVKITTGTTVRVTPSLYWRRRKDHYLLDRNNPAFYENFHLTDVYGSQLNISFNGRNISTSLGYDLRSENILSNNIGYEYSNPVPVKGEDSAYYSKRYSRTNFAYFQEHSVVFNNLQVTGGVMVNFNTDYADKPSVFPGLDASYLIFEGARIYVSVNRSLHLPTFTDMFYKDPVNQGSIGLKPNSLISFEGGLKYNTKLINTFLSVFHHSSSDMIDWLWSYTSNRYSPVNLDHYHAWGLSTGLTLNLKGITVAENLAKKISVNYMFLNLKKSLPDSVSKYNNLKHKLSVSITQQLIKSITLSWNISYQDRFGEIVGYRDSDKQYFSDAYEPFWLIDGCIRWSWQYIELFTEMSNILNTRYIDAGSIIQPGRWLKAGLVLKLGAMENLP